MLNSPSNPTGTVYTRAELEALAEVVLASPLAVLSDEVYERLLFGDAQATCFATLRPELAERTLTISGGEQDLRHDRLAHRLDCGTSAGDQGHGQYPEPADQQSLQYQPVRRRGRPGGRPDLRRGHAAGVRGPPRTGLSPPGRPARRRLSDSRRGLLRLLQGRRPLRSNPGRSPGNRFATFCQAALESAHVNLVPGAAFGAEGYVRLSFAASREQLNGGLDKLEQFLQKDEG